ncbi:MAG: amidohydrolase family protein [Lentisphaerae bacterium]|nr:amidohydrolase family protein [Lentisphaerota bacterium]
MPAEDLAAIDIHGHLGPYRGSGHDLTDAFYSGDARVVVERARKARTALTVVSSLKALLPRQGADPLTGNAETADAIAAWDELCQWAVVDPLKPETYSQALDMLVSPKCVGVKIHPEEHGYPIREHGRKIFEFAETHDIVLQSHSGDKNSMPADFLTLVNDFPGVRIIIAHLGYAWDGDMTHQVRALAASKHGNLFSDTSSAKQITSGFLEWAVRELGADRILYGTDTPLYFAPMQRSRIDQADLRAGEKQAILRDNARRLLRLP